MLSVLLTLVVVGVLLYLAELVPMDATIKTILRVVVILFVIVWLAGVFGVLDMPVPRLR
jgi:hypothetical protein